MLFTVEHLASLRLEGKVVLSLTSGFWGLGDYPKRFTELRWILSVSDPGLSKAFRRLQGEGIVMRNDRGLYHVKPELRDSLGTLLRPFYSSFLLERMRLVVEGLRRFNGIVALIVFGSVAQGKVNYDSDVDLLIVTDEGSESLEEEVHKTVSQMVSKMGIPIEVTIISLEDLKILLRHELQFLFGLLQGYIFLYDRVGAVGLLNAKEEDVKKRYEYHGEVPIWLPRTK